MHKAIKNMNKLCAVGQRQDYVVVYASIDLKLCNELGKDSHRKSEKASCNIFRKGSGLMSWKALHLRYILSKYSFGVMETIWDLQREFTKYLWTLENHTGNVFCRRKCFNRPSVDKKSSLLLSKLKMLLRSLQSASKMRVNSKAFSKCFAFQKHFPYLEANFKRLNVNF